ncbi:hypothetical protein SAMN02910456_02633 [Ruminococcaceae bacterium YRB3002]|nr:hypothetical protein SAMN02910456_02633 [Ruminococcaceae bacterium YRB3002]
MLTPDGYKNRLIDDRISRLMNIYGAVCVEGPKWCGKTWTSQNHCVSASFLGDPQGNFMNKQLAELDPNLVLAGELPRLIDEWQEVPSIWDAVKFKVDQSTQKGQFVLTGSSTPVMKGELHGGSGRIGRITMRTMSLYETGNSTGVVSLMDLFDHSVVPASIPQPELDELIGYVIRGGWPGNQGVPIEDAMQIPGDYLRNIPDDMERSDGKKRDARKVAALLRALGRSESNMTSRRTLQNDMEEYPEDREDTDSVSDNTIVDYLDCFLRLFLIEDQPAYENKLRSSIKALKKPKRHFTDPSLAAAAIGATPDMLRNDTNTFGYLFEGLCVRDLRIYADCHDGKVYHYHDERDNEADAIVELSDGRWGMFEIKVGFNQVEGAAQSLINLQTKMLEETGSKPEFLCVICGMCNAAYQRPDGVYVVPITALTM